jgi:hypothetical protein
VFVAVRDVGVSKIIAPVGAITIGPVTPACSLRNTGNAYQPVKAYFQVEQGGTPVWLDSIALAGLPAGDTLVQFGSYTAVPGVFTTTWWTVMAGDIMPANDTLRGSFQTGSVDVEARTITAPNGNVDTAAAVTPAATVRNNGSFPATFSAWFFIDSAGTRIYTSTRTVTGLGSNATTPVTFDLLPKPHFLGTYATRCSVYIAFDGDPANDVVDDNFDFVAAPPIPPGWHELSQMPAPPSSRQVKDGGWLAEDGDIIYAAKGNKTADFYRYSTDTDSWQTLAPIPLGREAKVPGKGAVGVVDGDVYAVKGNNTQGFWRYVPDLDSWYQMADIPLGTTGKKVKGGSDIVSVKKPGQGGGSYLYLLKGGKNEFWRYDPEIDSWAAMPNAPIGLSGKDKYDKGSWLVDRRMPRQGPRVIYAHKAKYHEMFVYNTEGDSWLPGQLKGMPYIGRLGKSKKSKDGGCGASGGEGIYALKGGNTQELWEYYVEGDSWKELDPMPLMGSTGKNKNVKAGADIVKSGDYHYALKGNKTLELWQFVSPVIPLAPERRGREGVLAGVTTGTSPALRLAPNPLASGFATVAYTLPKPGMVQVRVSDATGRTVQTRTVVAGRSGTLSLNLRSLAAGVYLVRLDADGYSAQQKLVVQH